MTPLSKQGLEAAYKAVEVSNGDTITLQPNLIEAAISAYLSTQVDGLEVATWTAECFSGRFTGMIKHKAGAYVLKTEALALQQANEAQREQIDRLTKELEHCGKALAIEVEDRLAAEARVAELTKDRIAAEGDALEAYRKLTAAEARLKQAEEVIRPFAQVAAHDIGLLEEDGDIFTPMANHNRAEKLKVGHLRAAEAFLENSNGQ